VEWPISSMILDKGSASSPKHTTAMAGPEPLIPEAMAPEAIQRLLILRASLSPVAAETAIPFDESESRGEPLIIDARDLSKI